jgi:uncharacterized protein (TIGR03437 family)
VVYDILSPSAMGLYQIAITVPDSARAATDKIVATVAGTTSPTGVLLAVK